MEEILMQNGFIKSENPNEYIKGCWTVRTEADEMEIFNDPDNCKEGLYYKGKIHEIDLQILLEEIGSFDFE